MFDGDIQFLFGNFFQNDQWLFLVPLKGGRWHSPSPNWQEKYHLYTTYILPSGGLYATYHPLQEPEKSIEMIRPSTFDLPNTSNCTPNGCE